MRKGATSQPSNGGGDFTLLLNAMGEPGFNSPLNAVMFPGAVPDSGLWSGYLSGLPGGNSNLQFTLPSMSNFSLPTSLFPSPLDLGQLQPPPSPRTLPVFSSEMGSGHRLFDAPETQATSHPLAQYYADRAHQQAVSRAIMRPAPVAGGLFRGTGDGGLFDGLMRQYPLVAGVNRYLSLPQGATFSTPLSLDAYSPPSTLIPDSPGTDWLNLGSALMGDPTTQKPLPSFSSAAGSPDAVLNNPIYDNHGMDLGFSYKWQDALQHPVSLTPPDLSDLFSPNPYRDPVADLRLADPVNKRAALNVAVDNFVNHEVAPRVETVARNTAGAVLPIVASGLTNAGIGSLVGPEGTAAGFIGGVLSGIGTRLFQDNVLAPALFGQEEWQRQQARTAELSQQHPYMAFLGQAIPALTLNQPLNPSSLFAQTEAGAIARAAAARQYGLGMGMEGANQLFTGQFDAGRLALVPLANTAMAGGSPTKFGTGLYNVGAETGGALRSGALHLRGIPEFGEGRTPIIAVEARVSDEANKPLYSLDDIQEGLRNDLLEAQRGNGPKGTIALLRAQGIRHRVVPIIGSYNGTISPGYGIELLDGDMNTARFVGSLQGLGNMQDAVAILNPTYNSPDGDLFAVVGKPGRQIPLKEAERIYKDVNKGYDKKLEFTRLPDGRLAFGNFRNIPEKEFLVRVRDASEGYAFGKVRSQGAYIDGGTFGTDENGILRQFPELQTEPNTYGDSLRRLSSPYVPTRQTEFSTQMDSLYRDPRIAVYRAYARMAGVDPDMVQAQIEAPVEQAKKLMSPPPKPR